ncbi:MAG TPA: hypothetical protein VM261_20255 [Kofleriaceae bacterium]|nr:hypothetical protein [Kofleriaceae bacterium]
MSQQPPKKSGSRDINELKARLGLKKGAAPAPTGKPNGSPSGGVVPPPGLAVPPPPGAVAPGPVVPNAADDPFGAMNAMAAQGAAQRAPEIVIVHDGKPVESVSAGTQAATIGKYIAIALVPFILGIAIRGISKDASAYNEGITGAKVLVNDIKNVKKQLAATKAKLDSDEIKKNDRSGKEVTAAITALSPDKWDVKSYDALKHKQNIGAELAGSVMSFYGDVASLQAMIKDHVKGAKADDAALNAARANSEKGFLPQNESIQKAVRYRFGVLVWNPSEEEMKTAEPVPFGARLVELGPPYCADGKRADTGSCTEQNPVESLAFRTGPGQPWQKADFAIPGQNINAGDAAPHKKVLIMSPTDTFLGLVSDCAGGGANCQKYVGGSAADTLYKKRVGQIVEKIDELIENANVLERKLAPKANESKRFTFFL